MVTPRGWLDLADAEHFYPDDLPDDWRLSYFANEFRASLLPAAIWTASDPLTISQWYEDVAPGFRFAAELAPTQPNKDTAQRLTPAALLDLLGSKLDGWLESRERPAPRITPRPNLDRWLHYQQLQTEQPLVTGQHCYALLVPTELHPDLRRAKDWLNRTTELQERAPSLVILERPTSNTLTAWQELLDLLGLG